MRTTADFLSFLRRQRRWTLDMVAAVPEEHFDWRPSEDSFSCGELVRHLIQADLFWARMLATLAAGEAFDPFGLEGSGEERMRAFRSPNLDFARRDDQGSSFAELLASWETAEAKVTRTLGEIPDEALDGVAGTHPLTRFEGRIWELMLLMLEHEAHHRGQLSAYLRVLGVPLPATFGT